MRSAVQNQSKTSSVRSDFTGVVQRLALHAPTPTHIARSPFVVSQRTQLSGAFGSAWHPQDNESIEAADPLKVASLSHGDDCGCASCGSPTVSPASTSSISHSQPIQRLCDQGHPFHSDGPCPFSAIDPPRRNGGDRSFRSIYTQPQDEHTGMNFLFNALQNQQQGVGMFYNGPTEVLHAPSTPIVSTTSHRDPSNTGKAFRQGTGDSSAKQHMERHGYQSGKNQHHRTHIGGFGQHGTIADNPSNIGSATKSTNGLMIPTDNHYPPGFINLNEGEVEEDTHVLHRIHQAISHPDDPTHPLFRYTHDGFRQFATGEEWDERQEWARNNLNEETLNGAHHLHLLNPNGHPTMDDYRDEEDTERTSELLMNMKHHGNNNNNDNDMDISDEED